MEDEKMGDKMNSPLEQKTVRRVRSQSGTEHVHYSIVYDGFPDEFKVMAEEKLKETPEARKRGLQRLRVFMKSQKYPPLKDDIYLLASLRSCKYDLKKAESKLKKLMSVRQDTSVRLRKLGMEKIEHILDDMPFGCLPYRDKYGRVICYTRPCGLRLELYTVADVAVVAVASILFALSSPITTVSGFSYFADCRSPSLYVFYSIFKEFKWAMWIILSLPFRLGRAECLYENVLCTWFYKVLEPFIPKKLYQRVKLHGSNLKEFHEMYHPDMLPEEYGGTIGPLSNEEYKQKFMDFFSSLIDEFKDKS